MSMIVPAGNKNVIWSPKDQNLTKTAAVGAQEEVNPLYEAAKKFAMDNMPCPKCEGECTCGKEGSSDIVEVSAPASSDSKGSSDAKSASGSPFGGSSDAKSDAKSDKGLGFETGDKGLEAGSSEKAKEVVKKLEEAVVEIKEICDVKSDDKGVAEEVTVDVGESKPIADAVTVDEGSGIGAEVVPGVVPEVSGTEVLEKESAPCAACGAMAGSKKKTKVAWNFDKKSDEKSGSKSDAKSAKSSSDTKGSDTKGSDDKSAKSSSDTKAATEVGMDKSASTEEEFTKFAKLSPVNKKKVADYWVNMLVFPKDYVALMTKDYEK